MSTPRPLRLADFLSLRVAGEPDPAADGRVVCVVRQVDVEADGYRSHLWLVEDGEARPLTSGAVEDHGPRWSPCGRRIAFCSRRNETGGIWVLELDGGEPWPLLQCRDRQPSALEWSPDGRHLAFLASPVTPPAQERAARTPGDATPRRGPKDGAPLVRRIRRPRYRLDGAGWLPDGRTHVSVLAVPERPIAARTDAPALTGGVASDGRPAWSPDGRWLAFARVEAKTVDEADWSANQAALWVVSAEGGEPRRVSRTRGGFDFPVWSPDGAWLAAVGTTHEEDIWGTYGPRLWLFPATGGDGVCLTEDLDRPVSDDSIGDQNDFEGGAEGFFADDGSALYFPVSDRGAVDLWRVPVAGGRRTGRPEPWVSGHHVLNGVRRAGRFVTGLLETPTRPAEVVLLRLESADAVPHEVWRTRLHDAWLGGLSLVTPRELLARAPDGHEVHGWILPPRPECRAASPPPALLEIHGGPHGQYAWNFFFEMQWLAARGYAVVYTNPRGSRGYGDAHAAVVREHFAHAAERDLLAAVDAAVRSGDADQERLGVLGGSGGGYLTSWLIAGTHRFRAACSQRSLNDWRTFYLGSDMGWHSHWQTGTLPWEDRERLRDLSPLVHAPAIETPLLVIHNEEDHRCPIEQGEQLFAWLRYQGKPVELLRFPGESHGLSRGGTPSRRLERLRAIGEWFDRHLLEPVAAPGRSPAS